MLMLPSPSKKNVYFFSAFAEGMSLRDDASLWG